MRAKHTGSHGGQGVRAKHMGSHGGARRGAKHVGSHGGQGVRAKHVESHGGRGGEPSTWGPMGCEAESQAHRVPWGARREREA